MKKFFKVAGIALAGVVVGVIGCVVAEKNGINIVETLSDMIPTSAEA